MLISAHRVPVDDSELPRRFIPVAAVLRGKAAEPSQVHFVEFAEAHSTYDEAVAAALNAAKSG